ncbi:MAG: DUF6364 family protein [Ginsengibacter sp.]
MTVKLNLTINKSIASKIKSYAQRKKISVSKIVENQLKEVLQEESKDSTFRDFLKKYAGSIKTIKDYTLSKDEYLKSKYGV